MHCYKMEEAVNENSEHGSESNRKPSADGIKNVKGFKRGHPYVESRNAATSEIRKKKTAACGCED